MPVVEEKIVSSLKCAVDDIDYALHQMDFPDNNPETKKHCDRLKKAKAKIEKVMKKGFEYWI